MIKPWTGLTLVACLREDVIRLQLNLAKLDDPDLEQVRDYLYKVRLELEQAMTRNPRD